MEIRQFEDAGLAYRVLEPDGYDAGRSYPLVILMHGYGSHMGDLVSLAPMIAPRGCLFAFPNAPIRMDFGLGMVGYAWSVPPEAEFDADGRSERLVEGFVEDVMSRYGVEDGRAALGGFSQGGMMAYRHGLRRPERFRALIALSSRISRLDLPGGSADSPPRQHIFIAHGTLDDVIPPKAGQQARRMLTARGYAPEYREYEMAHQVTPEVIADLASWLANALPPEGGTG